MNLRGSKRMMTRKVSCQGFRSGITADDSPKKETTALEIKLVLFQAYPKRTLKTEPEPEPEPMNNVIRMKVF